MEKTIKPTSGWMMLLLVLLFTVAAIFLFSMRQFLLGGILLGITYMFIAPGFLAIDPNSSRVMTLFGSYVGSIKESGFFFANPFYTKKKMSLRAVT
ncbi:MAG: hypothetical protein JNN28_20550, partial [Saprospiraceae bacterium]|nr:hypothetical protein [Saprospiraceae bacterium]